MSNSKEEKETPAKKAPANTMKIRSKCHVRVGSKRLKPNESAEVDKAVGAHLIGLGKAEKA